MSRTKMYVKGTEMILAKDVATEMLAAFEGHADVYVIEEDCCSHGVSIDYVCQECKDEELNSYAKEYGFKSIKVLSNCNTNIKAINICIDFCGIDHVSVAEEKYPELSYDNWTLYTYETGDRELVMFDGDGGHGYYTKIQRVQVLDDINFK